VLIVTATTEAKAALFHRVWPPVFIVLGLGVTALWTTLLGYGLFTLIGLAL
jgi:hypothetical protein